MGNCAVPPGFFAVAGWPLGHLDFHALSDIMTASNLKKRGENERHGENPEVTSGRRHRLV